MRRLTAFAERLLACVLALVAFHATRGNLLVGMGAGVAAMVLIGLQ